MSETRRDSGPGGLLVLDKPAGMTSRAALDRALGCFPRGTRMGHTGTLDPLATGVLVLCLGKATRLAEHVQQMPKTYRSTFQLGARSTTDDAEGDVTASGFAAPPDMSQLSAALQGFVGTIDQVPPAFSAAKVTGRRAYDIARAGDGVTLAARPVEIFGVDILAYTFPLLDVEVRCGKGTYIRSLARDLGASLGCGAFVQALRRTRVGPFAADDAVTLDADCSAMRARVLPPEAAVADLARVDLPSEEAERFLHGQAVPLPLMNAETTEAAVFDPLGRLIGVAKVDARLQLLTPQKVFPRF
jgi:tRNA pseudouridine55 synthase